MALVEKKVFPREKTCGDGLTPRSVRQIADMGIEGALTGAHRFGGLRAHAYGKVLDLPWPDHPSFPSYGYVITRHDLDAIVNERAVKAGATVWQGTEAVEPILDDPATRRAAGHAGADAARRAWGPWSRTSPPGPPARSGPGTWWWPTGPTRGSAGPSGPPGTAASPWAWPCAATTPPPGTTSRSSSPTSTSGTTTARWSPGYGWIFPLGDGRVNVGVGLLSTDRRWKGVNTSTLMEHFVAWAPKEWELSPATCLGPPTGGKLPMGLAVGPRVGATTLVVGDAAGSINPFNGEGIAYGYETGRLAAASLGEALRGDGAEALDRYETRLEDAYGLYYRVARAFIRMISRPELMQLCVGTGMYSESLMSWIFRIMANLLRPDETGPAEAAYRALALIARGHSRRASDRRHRTAPRRASTCRRPGPHGR